MRCPNKAKGTQEVMRICILAHEVMGMVRLGVIAMVFLKILKYPGLVQQAATLLSSSQYPALLKPSLKSSCMLIKGPIF